MTNGDGDDDVSSEAPVAPRTKVRLYLRASGLPRSITNQQPDTLCSCRISAVESGNVPEVKTEIVYKSSHPRYAASFPFDYEYGTQLLIFVFVYAVRSSKNYSSSSGLKLLGKAVFDVQDVLGMKYQLKARRLPNGGIIYAHIEQEFSSNNVDTNTTSISRSITGSISGSPNNSRILTLRLRARSLVHTTSLIQNRLAPSIITSKPDTYYEISRPAYSTSDNGTATVHKSASSSPWIVVYRSPPVTESITPMWDEAMIDLSSLCCTSTTATASNDDDLSSYLVLVSIYKLTKRMCKEIGSFETTVHRLIESCSTKATTLEESFQLQPSSRRGPLQSNDTTGEIIVVSAFVQLSNEVRHRSQQILSYDFSSEEENDVLVENSNSSINNMCSMAADLKVNGSSPSSFTRPQTAKFSDYVDAGLDIDFCVAIDFTSSNGDPRRPGTLHYSRDGMTNDYEDALESIGSTVEKYNRAKEFPVWGFGAKFDGQVRHIFQCGQSPAASGIQGVLDAYRSVFESDLIMSGPTVLLSVLKAAASRAYKFYNDTSKLKYSILLILTDGVVDDLQSTRELILTYSHLPLSIIVVGIGRADFTEMHQWNDESSEPRRGRFTFVEFRTLQFDPAALSRKALEKVPRDIVDYFIGRNISPNERC